VHAENLTHQSAKIMWTPSYSATKFKLTRRAAEDQFLLDVSDAIEIVETDKPEFEFTNLTPGEFQMVTVFAGTTVFETAGQKVVFVPLEPPRNILAVPQLRGARLTWWPMKGADMYRIDQQTSTGQFETLARSITATDFDVSNVTQGETLVFRVHSGFRGAFESVGELVSYMSVEGVSSVQITDLRGDGVTLTWEEVTNASKYRVRVSPAVKGENAVNGEELEEQETETNTASFSNLQPGTLYNVFVNAGTEQGYGSAGAFAQVMPLSTVTNLFADHTEVKTEALLSWSPSPGATRYAVQQQKLDPRSSIENDEFTDVATLINTRLIVEDLDSTAEYRFRVFACSGDFMETVGATVELLEPINLNPKTAKEEEETIDKLMVRMLKELEKEIPGINEITNKVGANIYTVGANKLNLAFQQKTVMVRVGGGFEEFMSWIRNHKNKIQNYLSTAVARVSSVNPSTPTIRPPNHSRIGSLPTMRSNERSSSSSSTSESIGSPKTPRTPLNRGYSATLPAPLSSGAKRPGSKVYAPTIAIVTGARLQEIQDLLQKGLITEEDFNSKKRDILASI
jgi:hypothetical protein